MQSDLLFFQSPSQDSTAPVKTFFPDAGKVSRPANDSPLPGGHSIFLSILRQIKTAPQQPESDCGLLESLLMAKQPLGDDRHGSASILLDQIAGEPDWFDSLKKLASGLNDPEHVSSGASADPRHRDALIDLLDHLAAAVIGDRENVPFSDPKTRSVAQVTDKPAQISDLKSTLLKVLDTVLNDPLSDRSLPSSTHSQASDTDLTRLISLLENRAVHTAKTIPASHPPGPATPSEQPGSEGLSTKFLLQPSVQDLMPGRESAATTPDAATVDERYASIDPAVKTEYPDGVNSANVQARLMNHIAYVQSGPNGMATNPTAPGERPSGIHHLDEAAPDQPKPTGGLSVSGSMPEKMSPSSGDIYDQKERPAGSGWDFSRQMKPLDGREIAGGGKDTAANRVKTAADPMPPDGRGLQSGEQVPDSVDQKPIIDRKAAVDSPVSETRPFFSEADKDSREFLTSASGRSFADGIVREDAGGRAAGPMTEIGDRIALFSNARPAEGAAATASSSKDADPANAFDRASALNQIVERAVLNLKNGQSEVRLNLKPEFLGQVQMRIITENHQVTLKIATEFLAVKEIIENNIQQLRSDLQHHGLEINSLDVSLTRDPQQQGNGHQPAGLLKAHDKPGAESEKGQQDQTELNQTDGSGGEDGKDNAIDYFA